MSGPTALLRQCCVILVAVAGLAGASSAALAAVYAREEFAEPRTRPKAIALLPVQAELTEATVASSQESIAAAEPLEVAGTREIAGALEQRGYKLRLLSREEIDSDPVLVDARRRLHGRYAQLRERLLARPIEVESEHYGFGKEGRLLAAHLGVDGIAIARMHFVSAGAAKTVLAMTLGLPLGEPGQAGMDLVVVDGATGNVTALFINVLMATSDAIHAHADELIQALVRTTLDGYPAIDEALVKPEPAQQLIGQIGAGASSGLHSAWYVSSKRDGSVVAESATEATDAQVIAELKALLAPEAQSMPQATGDSASPTDTVP